MSKVLAKINTLTVKREYAAVVLEVAPIDSYYEFDVDPQHIVEEEGRKILDFEGVKGIIRDMATIVNVTFDAEIIGGGNDY